MKILIADDNEMSLRRVSRMTAKWGYDPIPYGDGLSAWHALQQDHSLRLAILDGQMPGLTGVEICGRLRSIAGDPYRVLILLTNAFDRDSMITGLQAGADDFLRKPFDAAELELRLRTASRILELQDRLLRSQEELRIQANSDALTGLLNRRAILSAVERQYGQAKFDHEPCGIMLLDIDYFKAVNDTYGHLAGDDVLRHVANVIRSQVRPQDIVGRLGGEEFLIVCPAATPRVTAWIGQCILENVRRTPFALTSANGATITLTTSIGVTTMDATTPTVPGALKQCDDAMYFAKASGRNRLKDFSDLFSFQAQACGTSGGSTDNLYGAGGADQSVESRSSIAPNLMEHVNPFLRVQVNR